MIRAAANYILAKSHSDPLHNASAGQQKLDQKIPLIATHSFTKETKAAGKNAHNEDDFKDYFEKYKGIRIDKGITDEDTGNMDETGFRAGCGRAHWIITLDPNKPLLLIDLENREYITSVESISGGGRTIPPMLILRGILILEKWAEENDLDEDILLATSPTKPATMFINWSKSMANCRWTICQSKVQNKYKDQKV